MLYKLYLFSAMKNYVLIENSVLPSGKWLILLQSASLTYQITCQRQIGWKYFNCVRRSMETTL